MTGRAVPIPRRRLVAGVLVVAALAVGLQQLAASTPTGERAPSVIGEVEGEPLQEARRCSRDDRDRATVARIREGVAPDSWVTSAAVQACPAAFDHLRVRYVGEVVGDVLGRDGGAWALVNDDDYALHVGPVTAHRDHRGTNSGMSVWLPDDLLAAVAHPGRPGRRGDVVEVAGTIERADPADGGGLTLRAQELRVVQPAVVLDAPLDVPQLVFALLATGVAVVLWLLRRRDVAAGYWS